jgi:hypothetical protein
MRSRDANDRLLARVRAAFSIGPERPQPQPLVLGRVEADAPSL